MPTTHALFIPALFAEDLEAEGLPATTAAMKVNERKKDIRRVEGALESLGVPFKHEKVGTSAKLTEAEVDSLNALLTEHLKSRSDLDIYPVE
jgi:hypothetical protein